MDLGLKNKVALVTGGSHGIGRAIAIGLAQEGCNVAICSRTRQRLDKTLSLLKSYDVQSLAIECDVMKRDEIEGTVSKVIDKFGSIHILINNVGGGGRWGKEIVEDTDEGVWLEVYEKNALAAIRFTNLAIPYMRKQKWGRVITITSIFGREGGGRPWFAMAKTAQTALMKSLSLKHYLAKDNITFNSVAPGAIMIPNTGWEKEARDNPEETKKLLQRDFPMERFGTPEEVANLVVFLASERASLINGVSIPVDGGQSRSMI